MYIKELIKTALVRKTSLSYLVKKTIFDFNLRIPFLNNLPVLEELELSKQSHDRFNPSLASNLEISATVFLLNTCIVR